jgi:hypothetical protein
MLKRLPMLELATELLGLLTINLVLPPGVVFTGLKKWLWAMLVAEMLARLWGYLVSPILLQTVHRRLIAARLIEQTMIPGRYTRRRRLTLWLRKTLNKEVSHLLLWLASTMWVWMAVLALMQPEARQMFKAKFNWAPLAMMLHKLCVTTLGEQAWTWISRQRRQPLRRHGRHESLRMELPRYGQDPWQ